MDNLGDKLQSLFSDPKGLEAIMGVAKALGQSSPKDGSGGKDPEKTEHAQGAGVGFDKESMAEISKVLGSPSIQNLLNKGKNERSTVLKAIRPYMHNNKQNKIDKVMKTMQSVELLLTTKDLL
ncbi:MAG TPA: hypothetical protein DCY74_03230 [Clostridiales bacterium]|jgi:hypothetical protein|nr:hypothetical protein [Clostridiales bacterium]HBE13164.1 hypothetical protein [Clostridiales bacterium]HCG36272.1 hypothetical protein [Clostridiales bacterium]